MVAQSLPDESALNCAIAVAMAQCRLPPVSQHARRHHWHLATRAADSHDGRDAVHCPATST